MGLLSGVCKVCNQVRGITMKNVPEIDINTKEDFIAVVEGEATRKLGSYGIDYDNTMQFSTDAEVAKWIGG